MGTPSMRGMAGRGPRGSRSARRSCRPRRGAPRRARGARGRGRRGPSWCRRPRGRRRRRPGSASRPPATPMRPRRSPGRRVLPQLSLAWITVQCAEFNDKRRPSDSCPTFTYIARVRVGRSSWNADVERASLGAPVGLRRLPGRARAGFRSARRARRGSVAGRDAGAVGARRAPGEAGGAFQVPGTRVWVDTTAYAVRTVSGRRRGDRGPGVGLMSEPLSSEENLLVRNSLERFPPVFPARSAHRLRGHGGVHRAAVAITPSAGLTRRISSPRVRQRSSSAPCGAAELGAGARPATARWQ